MTLRVLLEPGAARFLRQAPPVLQQRLRARLDALQRDPFPHDVKRVEGTPRKVFRVRVGEHRILYEVNLETHVVIVARIEHRKHAYD